MSPGCHLRPAILGSRRLTCRGARERGGQAMRVLVTEDDEVLATAVAAGLRREGMAVDVALDGDAALEHAGGQPL